MKEGILYKYLDIEGGKKMLENSNLQYTNAANFNCGFMMGKNGRVMSGLNIGK